MARGFPCTVARAGFGSFPWELQPCFSQDGMGRERAGRTLRDTWGSSGMVMGPNTFLQVSRRQHLLPSRLEGDGHWSSSGWGQVL